MTATAFDPRWQVLDDDGNPYPNCKLYCYEARTTTPALVYKDKELTVPHPQPVVSDPGGRMPRMFLLPIVYKLELTTADDENIWTEDDYGSLLDVETTPAGGGLISRAITMFHNGPLTSGDMFAAKTVGKAYNILSTSSECVAFAKIPPTAGFSIEGKINGIAVITFTWTAANGVATATGTSEFVPILAGESIEFTAPDPADATAGDISIYLAAQEV